MDPPESDRQCLFWCVRAGSYHIIKMDYFCTVGRSSLGPSAFISGFQHMYLYVCMCLSMGVCVCGGRYAWGEHAKIVDGKEDLCS